MQILAERLAAHAKGYRQEPMHPTRANAKKFSDACAHLKETYPEFLAAQLRESNGSGEETRAHKQVVALVTTLLEAKTPQEFDKKD